MLPHAMSRRMTRPLPPVLAEQMAPLFDEILLHFGASFKYVFNPETCMIVPGNIQTGLSILMHKTMFRLLHVIEHVPVIGVKLIVCTYVCMFVCIYVCIFVCVYVCVIVCMYIWENDQGCIRK